MLGGALRLVEDRVLPRMTDVFAISEDVAGAKARTRVTGPREARGGSVVLDVPHAEAVAIMQRSHLLLVLAPTNHSLMLPAKIFDYLGAGSTLLAIAEPGATLRLPSGG